MTRATNTIEELFGQPRALLGMVHVAALPGSPRHEGSLDAIVERAVAEARVYRDAGYHGVIIENMHDRPYLRGSVGPEVVAAMTAVGREIRRALGTPLGVQILAGANREALAVALACGASFVRVEGYVFAHVADEGLMQACAGDLLRYRRAIGADSIRVFADIKKKHAAHAITQDVDLVETAHAAEFFLADGVIITGAATGARTDPQDVARVARRVSIPVLVGSGVTPDDLPAFDHASAFIVGSWVKERGHWAESLSPERTAALARAFHALPR